MFMRSPLSRRKRRMSNQEPQEVIDARQQGAQGIRQDYANGAADAANAQAYADWAEQDYISKYGDTGRSAAAESTRPGDIARGGYDMNGQPKKAKRLFSDMVGSQMPANLISA